MGQPLDLLGHPLPSERLQGLDDAGVEHTPPLQQEAAVGHFVRQGVFEGVFQLGEEPRLIEELGRLEVHETTMQHRLRHVGDRLQQGQGHLHAGDRCRLEQALLLRWQPINARRQHCLHRAWDLNGLDVRRQPIGPPLTR
jgi:hypothetical protein